MYNFLLSERYRTMHQSSLYVFMVICIGLLLAAAVIIRINPSEEPLMAFSDAISVMLSFGLFIFAAVFTSSFSKDRQMLLQLSTQGHPRWRILIGQYVLSIATALFFAIVLLFIAILLGLLLFPNTGPERILFIRALLSHTTLAFLLMIPLHAIAFSLQYLMANIPMSVAVFFVITFFIPAGFSMTIGANRVLDWLIRLTPYYQSYDLFLVTGTTESFWMTALAILLNTGFWLGIALAKFTKSEL